MTGKPINQLKDQSWKSIVPKSASDYSDYHTLDVPKWASKLYKPTTESYLYIPEMPNKPSGR